MFDWLWLRLAEFGCVWMGLAAGFGWVWVNLAGVRYIWLGLAGFWLGLAGFGWVWLLDLGEFG